MLSLCVCEFIVVVCMREAAGEGVPEKDPGIQNQKQEPHTKLWGKISPQGPENTQASPPHFL